MRMQDPDFFERFQRGDKEALDAVFNKMRADLYRRAAYLLQNTEDAEDMVMDVLLLLWKKRDSINDQDHIAPWLRITIRNNCLNVNKKKKNLLVNALSFEDPNLSEEQTSQRLFLEYISIRVQDLLIADIMQALDHLPEIYKEVIVLNFFRSLTMSEVARVLKIRVKTAYARRDKALRLLKDTVKESMKKIF